MRTLHYGRAMRADIEREVWRKRVAGQSLLHLHARPCFAIFIVVITSLSTLHHCWTCCFLRKSDGKTQEKAKKCQSVVKSWVTPNYSMHWTRAT